MPSGAATVVKVYALKNFINAEIYVGISENPERRLHEHNTGKNRYTKAFKPWEIFFTEAHPDYSHARKREKYLKSAAGKKFLRRYMAGGSLPA
ncbi:MAG TPA: GIY-YIG nuclease family protein [Bacteroidia bacterium]|nr:GIY-YIG nuclease family protein [Bacteroidia bacterium]